MLTLAGLGLSDERDVTLRGIEAARGADKVYLELYTGKWLGSVENLQNLIGKQVFPLKRSDMEENSGLLLEEARSKNILVFTQGDPMVATTHTSLLLEARKMGIETRIVHGSSIFSAVAETGLHIYKFGPTATIPFPEKTGGRLPKSVYDLIRDNRSRGLHTMCLLDVGNSPGVYMTPTQGVDLILAMERQFGEGVVAHGEKIVVLCKAGTGSGFFYDHIEAFQTGSFSSTPAIIILLGRTHFSESDFLEEFRSK